MCALFTDDDVGKSVENAAGDAVGVVASVEGDLAHVRPNADAVDSIKSSIGWEGVADETRPLDPGSVREITADAVRLEGSLPVADEEPDSSDVDETVRGDDTTAPDTEPAGGSTETEETAVADDTRDGTNAGGIESRESVEDERERDRGLEADPTELARENREAGTREGISVDPHEDYEPTDAAVEPDEEYEPTDAAVEPDEDRQPTDAAVDPTDEPRRTDAAVDPGETPRRDETEIDPNAVRDSGSVDGGPTTEDARAADLEDGPERERRSDREDGSESNEER